MLYISQEKNRGHISSFNMGGSKLFSHPSYTEIETLNGLLIGLDTIQ